MLFALGAAAFFLAGGRPLLGSRPAQVMHALVIDVSGSMRSRPTDIEALVRNIDLPDGHGFIRFELSDALRQAGGPRGDGTDYSRMGEIAADPRITGEVVLLTDGRGEIDKLYGAVNPRRLILLRAPAPTAPDASVLSFQSPGFAPEGALVMLHGVVRCDKDAEVPWRVLQGAQELASGVVSLRAELPASISHSQLVTGTGVARFRLVLDLENDREPANDEATTALQVGGRVRVEYCVEPGLTPELDGLLQLLRSDSRLDVRVRNDLPLTGPELEQTGVVVINNLPLRTAGMAREQTTRLADWVHSGGCLFMLGTDGAFGPGGYRGSPLENVMPVRFRPDDSSPRRTLLLLDVSDSMNQTLSGGVTRLARLQEAAVRVLESLGPDDFAAVVGFREGIRGEVRFLHPEDPGLAQAMALLRAQGSTHIGTSLNQALELLPANGQNTRILMITDGENVEAAGESDFAAIAERLAQQSVRLDIVLTGSTGQAWSLSLTRGAPTQARIWNLQSGDFEDLIELLDQALADADRDWVLNDELAVPGVATLLPRLVRTAPRLESSANMLLRAERGPDSWPLLATRRLGGRTACLCTDSWGDATLSSFWQDASFRAKLSEALEFVLGGAGRVKLVLNPLPEGGAELVWTGHGDPPAEDLRTDAGAPALLHSPGRWFLASWPTGEQLSVFDNQRLLQRLPLPLPVPAELRATGDDEVFFAVAEEGGIRVLQSLNAWKPARTTESAERPTDISWAPALLAMLLLLAGFALRKR